MNAKVGDPKAILKKATGGGAHGVLITAPSLTAFKQDYWVESKARYGRACRAASMRIPAPPYSMSLRVV
jgi:hypothetical protein